MRLVFVHGGVSGRGRPDAPSLKGAVDKGLAAQVALDMAEEAVVVLEDMEDLNAGYGAALTRSGDVELDAGIVDGVTGSAGGVTAVRCKNPIRLARRVLERSPHVLMVGQGAQAFGEDLPLLDDTTEEQRRRWVDAVAEAAFDEFGSPEQVDTVGAVTLDGARKLAAASSSGGVFGKQSGRVGDTPVFGAGIYASPGAAAIGTGVGELFIETLASYRVGSLIESGMDPQQACEEVIVLMGRRRDVTAGLLALDARGRHGAAYRGGSWNVWGPEGPVEAVKVD